MQYNNAMYVGCNVELWMDVASRLLKKHDIKPVYFIGRKPEFSKDKINSYFPNCFFQYTEDAWKGNGFPQDHKIVALDENTVKSIGLDILTGMRMMDRLDVFKTFPSTERQAWFIDLIEKWLYILEDREIDIIISPSIPHRVFDFALYVASKIKNIKFIMFQMTHFGDGSFIIDDVNMTPIAIKNAVRNAKDAKLDDLPIVIADKLKKLSQDHETALPPDMVEQKNNFEKYKSISYQVKSMLFDLKKIGNVFQTSPTYRIFYKEHPKTSSMTKGNAFLIRKAGEYKKYKLRNTYKSYCRKVDLNEKFVLLALHYQPEETSCPTGGFYVEQRQIVKNLLESFDDSVSIYIKEHSSQFYPYFEGETGRDESFYREISSMSNRVKFVPIETDTFSLIDSALAIATISGTIGWEALFRSKPVLLFGRGWYEDLPGVFKVKSKGDLFTAVTSIETGAYTDRLKLNRLYGAHLEMSKFIIYSAHYFDFHQMGLTNKEESIDNIVSGISDFLSIKSE